VGLIYGSYKCCADTVLIQHREQLPAMNMNKLLGFLQVLVLSSLVATSPINGTSESEDEAIVNALDDKDVCAGVSCGMGRCMPDRTGAGKECVCDFKWIDDKDEPCAYQAKSKLVAFLLSFFLGGLGADWFYLSCGTAGYIVGGIAKIIFSFILPGCGKALMSAGEAAAVCGGCCLCVMPGFIWWCVDWIRVVNNSFYDGMGMPLFYDM